MKHVTTTRARRAKQQRAREGAALVQALLVSLVMMVTMACVIMFARAYGAKIGAGVLAREAAWTAGGQGCPEGADQGASTGAGLAQQGGTSATSMTQTMMQAMFRISPATPMPGDTTADAPILLGGETIGFQTVTQFSCNEEPRPEGDLVSIASAVFDLITDIL